MEKSMFVWPTTMQNVTKCSEFANDVELRIRSTDNIQQTTFTLHGCLDRMFWMLQWINYAAFHWKVDSAFTDCVDCFCSVDLDAVWHTVCMEEIWRTHGLLWIQYGLWSMYILPSHLGFAYKKLLNYNTTVSDDACLPSFRSAHATIQWHIDGDEQWCLKELLKVPTRRPPQ